MDKKEGGYGAKTAMRYLFDQTYLIGREITKATDKIIPGKRARRDYTLRTRVNQLLDGELPDEELTKLGFQTSYVKSGYTGSLVFITIGIATLNPVVLISSVGMGAVSVLHQLAMSKNLKNTVEKMSEEERKELKEFLKDKDTYQFRDALYTELRF